MSLNKWERFAIDHAHARALYAQSCGADEQLCAAIAYHHGGRSGVRVPSPLAAAVQLAEALAGMLAGAPPDWALTDEALGALALERAALDEIARAAAGGHPPPRLPSGLSAQVAELERLAHRDDLTGLLSRRAWIEHARQPPRHPSGGNPPALRRRRVQAGQRHLGPPGRRRAAHPARADPRPARNRRAARRRRSALWLHDPSDPPAQIADTILAQTAITFEWTSAADHPAGTRISIGIATAPADARDLATLLELADAALYQAKHAGGRRARVARPHCAGEATREQRTAPAPRAARRADRDTPDQDSHPRLA